MSGSTLFSAGLYLGYGVWLHNALIKDLFGQPLTVERIQQSMSDYEGLRDSASILLHLSQLVLGHISTYVNSPNPIFQPVRWTEVSDEEDVRA